MPGVVRRDWSYAIFPWDFSGERSSGAGTRTAAGDRGRLLPTQKDLAALSTRAHDGLYRLLLALAAVAAPGDRVFGCRHGLSPVPGRRISTAPARQTRWRADVTLRSLEAKSARLMVAGGYAGLRDGEPVGWTVTADLSAREIRGAGRGAADALELGRADEAWPGKRRLVMPSRPAGIGRKRSALTRGRWTGWTRFGCRPPARTCSRRLEPGAVAGLERGKRRDCR